MVTQGKTGCFSRVLAWKLHERGLSEGLRAKPTVRARYAHVMG